MRISKYHWQSLRSPEGGALERVEVGDLVLQPWFPVIGVVLENCSNGQCLVLWNETKNIQEAYLKVKIRIPSTLTFVNINYTVRKNKVEEP